MFKFICLFFPTFIALDVLKQNKKILDIFDYITKYCAYNTIVNFIMLCIIHIYVGFEQKIINDQLFTVSFCFKYLFISSVLSFLISKLYIYNKENEIIKIEVVDNEKISNKKTKRK